MSRMHIHRWLYLLMLVLLVTTITGCAEQMLTKLLSGAGDQPPDPRQRSEGIQGGIWSEALPRPLLTFDPAFAVSTTEGRVLSLVFDGLVRLSPDGEIVAGLAQDWQVSEQGRVYQFRLRPDAKFHTGDPVTAADVVFSFRRLLDPEVGSPRSWILEAVQGADAFAQGLTRDLPGIEAVDERTVRITLARPFAPFLELLTTPSAAIVSAQHPPAGINRLPVGAGPFRLTGREEDGSLRLEAFEEYYAGRPHLDGIELPVISDTEERLEAFLAGRLHVLDLSPAVARRLQEDMGWTGPIHRVNLPVVYYLALNNSKPPLNDPLVRMAINHAIDREKILTNLFGDDYVLANGSIPPGFPGYDPQATGFEYDPIKARQLLAQAGYSDGFTLNLVESTSPLAQTINRQIKDMLAEVDIDVQIHSLSQEDFWVAIGGPDNNDALAVDDQMDDEPDTNVVANLDDEVDAFLLSWAADYPSSENFLFPLFHSSRWGAGGNRARFGSPETDHILEHLHEIRKSSEAASIYSQVERAIFQRAPWVPLYFPVTYRAVRPEVRGYSVPVVYHEQKLWDVWLEPTTANSAGDEETISD